MDELTKVEVTPAVATEEGESSPSHEVFCFESVSDFLLQKNKKLVGRVTSREEAENYVHDMQAANPNHLYVVVPL